MQITVAVGLDQLHELPMATRRQIHAALKLPEGNQQAPTEPQPPAYAIQYPQPQQIQPLPYQPPVHQGPPPILSGNTMVFPPAMGHPSQMNSAKDVMTGQPVNVPQQQAAPPVPQYSNTPVNVGPVATSGPPTVTQHNGIKAVDVRNHFIRLTQDQTRGGLANAALARSGIHQLAALTDQNAHVLWQAIVELGGQ